MIKNKKICIGWFFLFILIIVIVQGLYYCPYLIKSYLHESSVSKSLDILLVINSILVVFYGLMRKVEPQKIYDIILQLENSKFDNLRDGYNAYEYQYAKNKKRNKEINLIKIINAIALCMLITNIIAYMCSINVEKWFIILVCTILIITVCGYASLIDNLYKTYENKYPEPISLLNVRKVYKILSLENSRIDKNIVLKILSKGLYIKSIEDVFCKNKSKKDEMHLRLEMALPFIFNNAKLEIIDEEGKDFIVDLDKALVKSLSNIFVIDILLKEKVLLNKNTIIDITIYNEENQIAAIYFEQCAVNQYKSVDFVVTYNLNDEQWSKKGCMIGYRVD